MRIEKKKREYRLLEDEEDERRGRRQIRGEVGRGDRDGREGRGGGRRTGHLTERRDK